MCDTPTSSGRNDLHDLQYRISQLEHLFVNSTLNTGDRYGDQTNGNGNFAQEETDSLPELTQQTFINRVSALENLLAASELDNKNLQKQLHDVTVEQNKTEFNLLEKIYAKELEITELQKSVSLLNVKLSKSEARLEHVKDYILKLPSVEELDESQKQLKLLEDENNLLKCKNERISEKNQELQKELIQKEFLYQTALTR